MDPVYRDIAESLVVSGACREVYLPALEQALIEHSTSLLSVLSRSGHDKDNSPNLIGGYQPHPASRWSAPQPPNSE